MASTLVRISALLSVPLLVAACSSSSTTGDSATSAAASATESAAQSPAAGGQTAPLPTGGAELADTKWTLSGVNWTTDDVSTYKITIEFTADAVSGFAGVNQYNGTYTASADGKLSFGPLATTKMAGDEAAMKIEQEYLAALAKVTNYGTSDTLLDMFAGPDQILTFTKAS